MKGFGGAIVAALALLIAAPASSQAPAPAPALPKAPLPYAQIRPKPKAPALTTQAAHPAAPTVAGPVPDAEALPRQPDGARLARGQAIDPAELEAFLDGWIADAMAREHIAGTAVSVVQNGQVILKKGYGFADLARRRPVDPDTTMFRIGSISKTFTWILLMKEVEAGRIRLDRPVNLYLPEKVRLPGKGRDVMVANLLDHSGGFEDRALGQLFEKDPRRVRPLDLYLRQERPGRVRAPGLLPSYSNFGAALAGEAVSFVSGKTFERRVEDDITVPLGMGHTTFREPRPDRLGLPAPMPAALRGDVAGGYAWRNGAFTRNAYEYIGQVAPAGAGSSTAGDMSRYMLMLLGDGTWNGVTVFGPRAAKAFRTPLRRTHPGINGWAHGFMTFDLPGGVKGYGHLGHTIAFKSNMTLAPDLGLGVFVTTNSETGDRLADILPEALVRHFYAPPQVFPRPGSAELVAAADRFAGHYLTTRRAYGGLEEFVGLLSGGAQVSVTPGGRLITAGPGGVRAWVPAGPVANGDFVSTLGDARLAFRLGDGPAISFQTADNTQTMQRAAFWQQPTFMISLTLLTAIAAVATLFGSALRNRRELRQNTIQARAGLIQNIQAGLWLAAIVLFGVWSAGAGDAQAVMYGWPGPLLITASTTALVASVLSLFTIAALPAVWQGGRRVDSWTVLRKLFFTSTVLVYSGFSVMLAMAGALEPWSR